MTTIKDIYNFNNPRITYDEDKPNARLNINIDFPCRTNSKRILRVTKEIPLYYKGEIR